MCEAIWAERKDRHPESTAATGTGAVRSSKSHRAFFAPHPLAYGMSRVFITFREASGQEQMRVFAERHEALGWLGVSPFWVTNSFASMHSVVCVASIQIREVTAWEPPPQASSHSPASSAVRSSGCSFTRICLSVISTKIQGAF